MKSKLEPQVASPESLRKEWFANFVISLQGEQRTEDFAALVGVSDTNIRNFKRGKIDPLAISIDKALTLTELAGISLQDFLEECRGYEASRGNIKPRNEIPSEAKATASLNFWLPRVSPQWRLRVAINLIDSVMVLNSGFNEFLRAFQFELTRWADALNLEPESKEFLDEMEQILSMPRYLILQLYRSQVGPEAVSYSVLEAIAEAEIKGRTKLPDGFVLRTTSGKVYQIEDLSQLVQVNGHAIQNGSET